MKGNTSVSSEFITDLWFYSWILIATVGEKITKYITLTKSLLVLSHSQFIIKGIQPVFLLSWIKKFNVKAFICLMTVNSCYIRDLLFVGSLQRAVRPIVIHMS